MEFFFPSRLIFWWDLLPQKFLPLDFLQEVLISAAPLAYPVGGFLAIFAYFSIAFHGLYLVKNFLFLEPIFFREILLFAICDMPRWYGDFFFSPKLVFFRGFLAFFAAYSDGPGGFFSPRKQCFIGLFGHCA